MNKNNLKAQNISDVIIIGAGLAGITAALEILTKNPNTKITIIEKTTIGGMCRSIKTDDTFFDIGGHFFHNLDKLPDVYKAFADFCLPFNKNTYTIDTEGKLYHGMIQNFFQPRPKDIQDISNLENYFISTFGEELYKVFLKSYNQKLNISLLKDCEPSSLTKARTPEKGKQSYNAFFVYPKNGGCESFIKFLWDKIKERVSIIYDEAVNFNLENKTVSLKSDKMLKYKKYLFNSSSIVSYMGLDEFSPTVYVYNGFGKVRKEFLHLEQDPNWTYIANPKTPIFRLGNYQICGARSRGKEIPFYLESCRKLEEKDLEMFFEQEEITSEFVVKNAYPVLTKGIQNKIAEFIKNSKQKGLFWVGRYGKDKWLSMAETIIDTKKVVEEITWN